MFELIEWGFESMADRFGIQRRHIFFGVFVLFLMTLCTLWYIYEKNWVVVSTRKGIRSEQQMTISLDGEESAVQEMSNDIRNNILDTPWPPPPPALPWRNPRQTETPSAAIPKTPPPLPSPLPEAPRPRQLPALPGQPVAPPLLPVPLRPMRVSWPAKLGQRPARP